MKYESLTIREASLLINNKIASFLNEHIEIKDQLEQDGDVFNNNVGDICLCSLDCNGYSDLDDNSFHQSVRVEGLIDLVKDGEDACAEFTATLIWDSEDEEFVEVSYFTSINDIKYDADSKIESDFEAMTVLKKLDVYGKEFEGTPEEIPEVIVMIFKYPFGSEQRMTISEASEHKLLEAKDSKTLFENCYAAFCKLYDKYNTAPHELCDYVIEGIDIFENHTCFVYIGS